MELKKTMQGVTLSVLREAHRVVEAERHTVSEPPLERELERVIRVPARPLETEVRRIWAGSDAAMA
jgi:hypothetical protein